MGTRNRKIVSIAFTGAAAALAVGMNPGNALAASHVKLTATNATFGIGGFTLTCKSAVASATLSGSWLKAISKWTFTSCSGLGLKFIVRMSESTPFDATTDMSGVSKGEFTGFRVTFSGSGNACHLLMSGLLPASYRDASHALAVDPAKTAAFAVKSVTSCPTIAVGDKADFTATYT